MEHNCIFCKIIKGEIPANKIYEDELVIAFMDIAPINFGHALVIPKQHHNSITTVPAEYQAAMMQVGTKIAQAIVREVDGDGFNLHLANGQVAGQVVPHAHLHIIPRKGTDGFNWGWRTLPYETESHAKELAEAIIKRIK